MDSRYAFVAFVRDSRWDSQDDNYFYKKYHFLAIYKSQLNLLEKHLKSPEKQKISPFSFHAVIDLDDAEYCAGILAKFWGDEIIKFHKNNSEVVREEKELYFFF